MTNAYLDPSIAPAPRVTEVSQGVFAYLQPDGGWCLNNAGVIVGRRAATVVDACVTSRRTRALLATVASLAPVPVQTLINTHYHLDHTTGNFVFPPSVTIVGHENCRAEMLQAASIPAGLNLFPGMDVSDVQIEPPQLTFADTLTLHVDGLRLDLIYLGPAHTNSDVVVWLPERRVLFAGDLAFNGVTPLIAAGSLAGSFRALERMRALEPALIVPGHGAVAGPEIFDDLAAYFALLQDAARRGMAAGQSPLAAARATDLGRFAGWVDRERLVANLHRAYAEAGGAPFDLRRAFAEMIELNGGRPLHCVA